ncbi:MAG: insulinase family protein [Candidatus Aureabacteria bacterium]|nr:insulinase family protein [Candidatus Auribacterota bacterium]
MKQMVLFILLLSFPCLAQEEFRLNPHLSVYELKNGLKVILSPRNQGELIAVRLFVKAGSMTENPYLGSGISHFVEHLCFKGSERGRTTSLTQEVRKKGGTVNAHTSFLNTVYEVTFPSIYLEDALKIVSDLVLHLRFSQEDFDKEKSVIEREMDMIEDDHDRYLSETFWHLAYCYSPVRYRVIGERSLFRKLTPDHVREYYEAHYVPGNMILSVTGNFFPTSVKPLIEKYYQFESRQFYPAAGVWNEPPPSAEKYLEVERERLPLYKAIIGWQTTDIHSIDVATLDVLSMILGEMKSSLLPYYLIPTGEILGISSWSFTPEFPGFLGIGFSWQDGSPEDKSVLVEKVIDKVKAGDFSNALLKTALQQVRLGLFLKMESVEGEAEILGSNLQTTGNVRYIETWLKDLERITKADIQEAAKKYLIPVRKTTLVLTPASKRPSPPPKKLEKIILRPVLLKLPSGLRVILLNDDRLPLTYVQWVGLGGTMAEPDHKEGVGALLGNILGTASRKLDRFSLDRKMDSLGSEVRGFSGRNSFGLSGTVVSENLPAILPDFFNLLLTPRWIKSDVEREKKILKVEMNTSMEDPFDRAAIEMRKALYGSHPYGRMIKGTVESISQMTTEDIESFYRQIFCLERGVLSIMGKFDLPWVMDWLHKMDRKKTPQIPPWKSTLLPVFQPCEKLIPLENVEQTILMLGYPTVSMHHEDALALDFLSAHLSEQNSPLFKRIREEKGWAYITGAESSCNLAGGHFIVYAAFKEDVMEEIDGIIQDIFFNLAKEDMPLDIFEETRSFLLGQDLRRMANTSDLGLRSALEELYGLGYDHYSKRAEKIKTLTPIQVRETVKKYFHNKSHVKLVVGKRAVCK